MFARARRTAFADGQKDTDAMTATNDDGSTGTRTTNARSPRSARRARRWQAVTLAGALTSALTSTLTATPAAAAEVPADAFRPAVDATGILDTEAGTTTGENNVDAGLFVDGALNPLVLGIRSDDGTVRREALVGQRVGANLLASLGFSRWGQLAFDLPVIAVQTRAPLSVEAIGAIAATPLAPVGLGDLRVRPKAQVLRARDAFVDVALLPTFTFPTHTQEGSFLGESAFTFVPEVAVSRALGDVKLATNVGVRLRGAQTRLGNTDIGNEFTYRAAVAWRVSSTTPVELAGAVTGAARLGEPFAQPSESPLEAMAGLSWWPTGSVKFTGGVGTGVVAGYGVPDVRAFVGVQFTGRDSDGDGVDDDADECPAQPEDKDDNADGDGCPDLDNDGDGVDDATDACGAQAEDKDGFDDGDGCPDLDNDGDGVPDVADRCKATAGVVAFAGCPAPDGDHDGVADADDRCPTVAGSAALAGCSDGDGDGVVDIDDRCPTVAGLASAAGCKDGDGDGVADELDRCPNEPETHDGVDDDDGCPDDKAPKVDLKADRISIREQVRFDLGKATIRPESFALLDQVATVLREHAEIAHLSIEGHTDDVGAAARNVALSSARAAAVREYLVKKGIAAARLKSQGFGSTEPLVKNDSDEHRQQNRRVEFRIVAK